jgi:hypothetical protein
LGFNFLSFGSFPTAFPLDGLNKWFILSAAAIFIAAAFCR